MKIARVFPTKTKATPIDELTYFGPPLMFMPEIYEVHISVLFTWDIPYAIKLYREWENIAPIKIGGPAFNYEENDFIPGRYVKKGYIITSRGCNNRCWFCSVWKRNPQIKELEIKDGWNLLDDNLLACSDKHIINVFNMLEKQKERPQFTGGLDPKELKPWHIDYFIKIKPQQMFFAYDTKDDLEPLMEASNLLIEAGFNRQAMRCYVLIGYPNDTFEKAEKRLNQTIALGFFPMAMLYRNKEGKRKKEWMRFQKKWARPASIYTMVKNSEIKQIYEDV